MRYTFSSIYNSVSSWLLFSWLPGLLLLSAALVCYHLLVTPLVSSTHEPHEHSALTSPDHCLHHTTTVTSTHTQTTALSSSHQSSHEQYYIMKNCSTFIRFKNTRKLYWSNISWPGAGEAWVGGGVERSETHDYYGLGQLRPTLSQCLTASPSTSHYLTLTQ